MYKIKLVPRCFVWVNRGKHLLKECIMFFKDSEKTRGKRNFSLFDLYIMSINPVTHLKVTKCVFK